VNTEDLAIGVDLGATKIATALVARDGQVLASRHAPTLPADGGFEGVGERIADEIRAILATCDASRVLGVGIGSAGLVDAEAGVVRWALNLGWRDVPSDNTELGDSAKATQPRFHQLFVGADIPSGASVAPAQARYRFRKLIPTITEKFGLRSRA